MSVKVLLFVTMLVMMPLIFTACGSNKEAAKPAEMQKATETTPLPEEAKSTVISKELKQRKNPTGKIYTKEDKIDELDATKRQVDNVVGRSERNAKRYDEIEAAGLKSSQLNQIANNAKTLSRDITLPSWITKEDVEVFKGQHDLLLISLDDRGNSYESLAKAVESKNNDGIQKAQLIIREANEKSVLAAKGMRTVLSDIEKKVKEGK